MSFEFDKPKGRGENLHRTVACQTCDGDRFVVVGTRQPQQSAWMLERGIKPRTEHVIEELSACPDCNPVDTSFWRGDGTRSEALDPAKVRQLMEPPKPRSKVVTPPAEARIQVDNILKGMD